MVKGLFAGVVLLVLATSGLAQTIDFEVEATFFRYHRGDGVNVGGAANDPAEFGFEVSPRFILSVVNDNGLGTRITYWVYDHEEMSSGSGRTVSVKTETLDFELFTLIELDQFTWLEFSGGIRYNKFAESGLDVGGIFEGETQRFEGLGGKIGVELNRQLTAQSSVYSRLNTAIMMDDWHNDVTGGSIRSDTTRVITEVAFGVQSWIGGWNLHAGVEWQDWDGYVGGSVPFGVPATTTGVGFAGFVAGGQFTYLVQLGCIQKASFPGRPPAIANRTPLR